ncbi:hypothetical protein FD977_01555 [Polynucleobacter sp. AP-Elch-400A-B2]|uniref:glycosyltransferase family 2 protein n=1 Tax=Polynucleobacter sp. AP-Elch-400A-B2 TaxID=2576930 RepID=UPI001BFEBEFC|nr:glycosyltransferase family 2 protein [Polynucleobacter sp. AP-Elch-400A-B2]QWE24972.1 hypothetical protein FD977_01555 [Polynucleobacter sp. AP-Elch-400A-B2]
MSVIIKAPVAVIVYNRPDHTRRLVECIKHHQFSHLIFIADGPKSPSDEGDCALVRSLVSRDWGCPVDYVFSRKNLGCRERVVSGLDFVFQKFPSAIILEDDCLPSDSFFDFCEMALRRYEANDQILMACGTVLVEPAQYEFSYFFSQIPHIWGWATWRNRWEKYSKKVTNYQEFYEFKKINGDLPEPFVWNLCENLRKIESGTLDTWDVQMTYLATSQNLLSVFPSKNLICNIGFDKRGTHTKQISVLGGLRLHQFDKHVKHPEVLAALSQNDLERMLLEGHAGNPWMRLIKVLRRRRGFSQVLNRLFLKMSDALCG